MVGSSQRGPVPVWSQPPALKLNLLCGASSHGPLKSRGVALWSVGLPLPDFPDSVPTRGFSSWPVWEATSIWVQARIILRLFPAFKFSQHLAIP